MNPTLFLPFTRQMSEGLQHGISIFLGDSRVSADQLDANLSQRLEGQPPLDFIHFVGYREHVHAARAAILQDGSLLKERLRALIGDKPVRFYDFDVVEGVHRCADVYGQPFLDAQVQIAAERRFSLMEVFRRSGGEERAPKGTHYAKTSESHSDRFLRVSNVVEDGRHVALLAFWLLPFLWKLDVGHIAVDTSNIFAVVLKAIQEAAVRHGIREHLPQVWSHRSHDGLDEIPEHLIGDAVFVVSASTSNKLVRKLKARKVSPSRIRTLFSLAPAADSEGLEGHEALCDLGYIKNGGTVLGLESIKNFDAMACPMCASHHHLIKIQGDQFSISPPRVSSVLIKKDDLDPRLRPILTALCGRRAFVAYRRVSEARVLSIAFNPRAVLEGDVHAKSSSELLRLRAHWASLLRRAQTLSLNYIVECDYPGSAHIANLAKTEAKIALAKPDFVEVVSSRDLSSTQNRPGSSALVVSAGLSEPQEFLSVSRALRDVLADGSISYLTVAELLPTADMAERLRSNITMGQHGVGTFSYAACIKIPIDCIDEQSSWELERHELQRLRSWLDDQDRDTPIAIEERITRLDGAQGTGLVDDLFWSTPEGQNLELRSDFTLVDGARDLPVATQADLFAIVSIILTGLRNRKENGSRLAQNAYERNMLSPINFSRYNDGVLQAAILRSARAGELAYAASDGSLSEDMLYILLDMLPGAGAPEKAEAIREFLISIMINRLSLQAKHKVKFLSRLVAVAAPNSVELVMAEYLLARST